MENKAAIIIQARTGSSRLPNKVFRQISSKTMIDLVITRLRSLETEIGIIIATTIDPKDDNLFQFCKDNRIDCYRGSENNVLERYFEAAKEYQIDTIIRITSDCPLIDPSLIRIALNMFSKGDFDYLSNTIRETFPDGQDIEIFKFKALKKAYFEAQKDYEKEHVTQFFLNNSDKFKIGEYNLLESYKNVRLTVDEEIDIVVINKLVDELGFFASWIDYSKMYIEKEFNIINGEIVRNEGLLKSKQNEKK